MDKLSNGAPNLSNGAQKELREYINKLERLAEAKAETAAEMAEVMKDAKHSGFDPKVIRKLLAIRKKGKDEYETEQALLETYLHAIGQLDGTPLAAYGRRVLEAAE